MGQLIAPCATAFVWLGVAAWQLTPVKRSCLSHCRAPATWLSQNYRSGVGGALSMGLLHGAYYVGCCLVLMLALFAGGVMDLRFVALLTLVVLLEKLAPPPRAIRLIVAGGPVLAALGALLRAA